MISSLLKMIQKCYDQMYPFCKYHRINKRALKPCCCKNGFSNTRTTMDDENFTKSNLGQICFSNEEEQVRADPVSWYGAGFAWAR